jgi:hypothetical protein
MSIEDIKQIMDGFDPAALLPDLSTLEGKAELICRIAVLVGPVLLLALGIAYLLFAPREANYHFGYRCFFGMGSVQAWRFTQKVAGALWGLLGLILTLVMVNKTNGFREMEIMDQIMGALKCLTWEAILAAFSCVAINLTALVFFNIKGDPRFKFMEK